MKRIQCELCGSIDILRTDDGFFQCQHCGCKYTLEQAKTILTGTVEIVKGHKELEQKLNNAETQKKLGEWHKMRQIYRSLTVDYPSEMIVWESILKSYYYMLLTVKSIPHMQDYSTSVFAELERYQSNAILMCTDESKKKVIVEEFNQFCAAFIQRILDGEFDLIALCSYYGFMRKKFMDFINHFPGAKKILDISNQNLKAIADSYIGCTHDGTWIVTNNWWLPQVQKKTDDKFLFGKWYVEYFTSSDGGDFYIIELKEPFDLKNLPQYCTEAYTRWNEMKECPVCHNKLGGLRKRTCRKCNHQTYPLIKF